jgi:intracellular sulfur oxidation DsrE/DsrF family protein
MNSTDTKSRRKFLGKMLGAATAASLPLAKMSTAAAQEGGPDAWLNGVTGNHKCLFDFPQHKGGAGLVHILNYIATYQAAYGADVSDVGAVGTLYSVGGQSSIPMAFNDDMWAKYKFGEYLSLDDPKTGEPAVRNLFYKHMEGDHLPRIGTIGPFPDASISALQDNMGVTFLVCNNAAIAAGMDLALLGLGDAAEITADLKNNIEDGVILVPAMVIAIEKAQAAGISYNKQ